MTMNALTFRMGHDGFIWWIGVVEDTTDKATANLRCRVRIFGSHPAETNKLATQDLPWALVLQPTTGSHQPHNLRIGDWVMGFFLDATLGQQPVVVGVLPGYSIDKLPPKG